MRTSKVKDLFLQQRSKLFGLAYRMLGTKSDAEDVLQEAWLSIESVCDDKEIIKPSAYLTRIVTNLCIDTLRERQRDMSVYRGPWLPEPVPSEYLQSVVETELSSDVNSKVRGDPSEQMLLAHDMSMALLHILERLNPRERAVLILKDVLGFSHDETADLLEMTSSNSRQLLSRARRVINGEKRFDVSEAQLEQELIGRLAVALSNNDVDALKDILCGDVCAYTDGGGLISAVPIPLRGFERVASVFIHLLQNQEGEPDLEWVETNNCCGLLIRSADGVHSHLSVTVRENKIAGIYIQRNPEKLKAVLL